MLGYATQFWIMWGVLVQAAGVVAQCLLIYMGFNTMRRANELRSRQLAAQEKAREAQHEENMAAIAEAAKRDDKRHEESMSALRELIRQNHELEARSAKRHEENMAAFEESAQRDEKRHEESMAALREHTRQNSEKHEENMAALKTLIERTAPAA